MAANLNTRFLRYLLSVVDEGSFSRAAERLSVSQPAISRRIKLLEEEFQFLLLERKPREVTLTPEGSIMIGSFRRLVECSIKVEQLVQQLNEERAKASIGVEANSVQTERVSLLDDFKMTFPKSSFNIKTGFSRSLIDDILKEKIDLIAISSPVPDERFEYIVLRWFPVQLAIPKESPLADYKIIPLSALKNMSIAAWERDWQPKLFDEIFAPLQDAGAKLCFTDDPGKFGILTYAADRGIAALLSFHEYGSLELERANMIARPLVGMRPVAGLLLLRLANGGFMRSEKLWAFAKRWVLKRGVQR